MIGRSIAHYEISSKLGQGGMGEVYRARDTRLNRDVALKVLPEVFALDEQRMGRFSREAQVLASLNHPNIAQVYGLEEMDPSPDAQETAPTKTMALVLELVDGETLAEQIGRGPISVNQSLGIALQIAEGLEDAHEKGIIHRDLKPANIKITPEGKVKVLDFGLAKALEDPLTSLDSSASAISQSPTLSMAATQAGIILGTAAYMSPEQARGKSVDRRTDIWAFGVVLFEMLSGRQMFTGEDLSMTFANVMTKEPDWGVLPNSVPRAIRRLLERCLTRNPQRRLRDIGEARIAIEDALNGSEGGDSVDTPRASASFWQYKWHALGLAVATALLSGLITWKTVPAVDVAQAPLRTFELMSGWDVSQPVISPDGTMVGFMLDDQLAVRDLKSLEPRILEEAQGIRAVFWSSDSQHLGYVIGREIRRIPAAGGPSTQVCRLSGTFLAAVWGVRGQILFTTAGGDQRRGVWSVSAAGGEPERIIIPEREKGEFDFHGMQFLPDGSLILEIHPTDSTWSFARQLGENREIFFSRSESRISDPLFSPATNHLLFSQFMPNPGVWAVPFSPSGGLVDGTPQLVAPGGNSPSVSSDGTLLYVGGVKTQGYQLAWIDRQGRILGPVGQPKGGRNPELSPNGKLVATSSNGIWILEIDRGTATPITSEGARVPAWSPQGDQIAYLKRGEGLLVQPSSGEGNARLLVEGSPEGWPTEPAWSPSGELIVYSLVDRDSHSDIWYVSSSGEDEPIKLLVTEADERSPQISPDGQFVAYVSNETGDDEVYVRRFPEGEGRWRISTQGGRFPKWNGDGSELFFVEGEQGATTLMSVQIDMAGEFKAALPEKLFYGPKSQTPLYIFGDAMYDPVPDGQQFVVFRPLFEGEPVVTVVQNWAAILDSP
ncbi:MAG: protein kinase [Acidobacteriota bacterium]|nr:MAG: protein kinase [Acidobacteriota bacterium]